MSNVSLDALRAMYEQETGDYPILLITAHHPKLTDDIRISSDFTTRLPGLTTDRNITYGTVSMSINYIYCPVTISWPDDMEASAPKSVLTVGNVGRELTEPLRSISFSPIIRMRIVLASNTDRVEKNFDGLKFEDVSINTLTVSGTLTMDMLESEPSPYITCTPSTTPGIFKI